jgi:hypothetical protein
LRSGCATGSAAPREADELFGEFDPPQIRFTSPRRGEVTEFEARMRDLTRR